MMWFASKDVLFVKRCMNVLGGSVVGSHDLSGQSSHHVSASDGAWGPGAHGHLRFQVGPDLPSDSDDMTLEQLAKLKRTDEDADAGPSPGLG